MKPDYLARFQTFTFGGAANRSSMLSLSVVLPVFEPCTLYDRAIAILAPASSLEFGLLSAPALCSS